MRVEGWERMLADYLGAAAAVPLEWGRHDCALWAATWARACSGNDAVSTWIGKYTTEQGAAREIRRRGFTCVADIADAHFAETPLALAGRGDMVLHPTTGSLGICNGRVSQFVGAAGAVRVDTLACTRAWAV